MMMMMMMILALGVGLDSDYCFEVSSTTSFRVSVNCHATSLIVVLLCGLYLIVNNRSSGTNPDKGLERQRRKHLCQRSR